MLLDVEPDELPQRADRIERIQIEPLMFEYASTTGHRDTSVRWSAIGFPATLTTTRWRFSEALSRAVPFARAF